MKISVIIFRKTELCHMNWLQSIDNSLRYYGKIIEISKTIKQQNPNYIHMFIIKIY